jgi:3-carboxy-cis,cis-muconate cycloisomerase
MAEKVEALFSTIAMDNVFSPEAHMRGMLAFEAALARAEARAGVIPQDAAHMIGESCRIEMFDVAALYREAKVAGTPAIPLVRMLTAQIKGDGKKFVHWGATSQDVIDTAMMLQVRDGIDLLLQGIIEVCDECAKLAEQYRETVMAGRTLLQQAVPITFGLKAARWLSMAVRQVHALRERRKHSLAVQLGGAAGTLAALGEHGTQVIDYLADELGLPAPELPWHSERDRVAEIAGTLGIVAGAMAKVASDVALLMQTEVGEVTEGTVAGKGGSSAMPQKHNPVDATFAIASAHLALGEVPIILAGMMQEHERGVGGWQAEWEALPGLFRYTSGAVEHVKEMVSRLVINHDRMSENLDATQGLIMAEALTMALAPHTGRTEAQRIVKSLCDRAVGQGIHLRQVAQEDKDVSGFFSLEEIDRAFDPRAYLGSTNVFIERALAAYREASTLEGGI